MVRDEAEDEKRSVLTGLICKDTKLKFYPGQVWWLTLVIPALWEAEAGRSFEVRSLRDQLGQHGKTPSLLKKYIYITKLTSCGGVCL